MGKTLELGKIVNTQGIRGDVRIMPSTDDVTRFELLKEITVTTKKETKQYTIEKVWYHKKFVVLKLVGINDMTAGETLKEGIITIPRELGVTLNEDEYFFGDLIDMNVVTVEGEELGKIIDIIETGANDVYHVRNKDKVEILLPAIKQCINKVDMENNLMTVTIMKGLRD